MGPASSARLCAGAGADSVCAMTPAITVHRVPWSTNVERVALAAAHKGIAVRWVDHPAADRRGLVGLSGQPLAPVLELPDGTVVTDSPAILEALEVLVPEPSLWPADPRGRATASIFVEWFNAVWKVAPNAIAEARAAGGRGHPGVTAHMAALRGSRGRFEALLGGRDHLLTQAFGIADVIAFPFLKYAVHLDPADPDPFHHVLHEALAPVGDMPRLAAWVARVDARPRA
ncbi:MAG: glutathione S-transferase family protein [Solirubrobacterales bacterium]|nr:glutathione S-transferase family protein [Solirubrobacterales bacterium]